MSTNGQFVDVFSVVMGPEHLGRLRQHEVGLRREL